MIMYYRVIDTLLVTQRQVPRIQTQHRFVDQIIGNPDISRRTGFNSFLCTRSSENLAVFLAGKILEPTFHTTHAQEKSTEVPKVTALAVKRSSQCAPIAPREKIHLVNKHAEIPATVSIDDRVMHDASRGSHHPVP